MAERDQVLGLPYDTAVAQRDILADEYGVDFGRDRVFPEVVRDLLAEIPEDSSVFEVGAATGVMTRELLARARSVTAMEVSAGMLEQLLASDIGSSAKLHAVQGIVEDLDRVVAFDVAVVTFTPRRGFALVQLVLELAARVRHCIVMLFDDDQTMDWAYLSRSLVARGFDVRAHLVHGGDCQRAVVLAVRVEGWEPILTTEDDWGVDAREICVPFPSPRGAAVRLVRYFLGVGDRALLVTTSPEGMERLYGNLRTAAHRLGRGEVTVRLHEGAIHLVRLPRGTGGEAEA